MTSNLNILKTKEKTRMGETGYLLRELWKFETEFLKIITTVNYKWRCQHQSYYGLSIAMVGVISKSIRAWKKVHKKTYTSEKSLFFILKYYWLDYSPMVTRRSFLKWFIILMFRNDWMLIAAKAVIFEECSGFTFIQIRIFGFLKSTVFFIYEIIVVKINFI